MKREEIKAFASDYIRFLKSKQAAISELYASLCYGGVVYEDTRINLYDLYPKFYGMVELDQLIDECSSNIGSLREYLAERSEDTLIRDNKEPIAYLQMPADIWDALYGMSELGEELEEYLTEEFEEFMEDHNMTYDLTEYGRNAALVYQKEN